MLAQAGYGWDDVLYDPFVQKKLLLALAIMLLALTLGYVVKSVLTWYAHKVAAKTNSQIDDFIMAAVHPPAVLIALTVGFWLAFREASDVLPFFVGTEILFFVLLVVLIAYTAGRLVKAALVHAGERKPNFRSVTNLGARLGYILAFTIAFLVVLSQFGIAITPMLTSLGIAGLAIGLALQDTLSNLFAGIWIQTSRVVRPGDFIRVEDVNQEGYVVEVSWRTTRIRTLPNHVVAIPNSKMASSVVSNYEMPQREQAALFEVGTSYNQDPEHVLKVLGRVAKQCVEEIPQIVKTFDPIVRLNGFGDSALNFLVIVRVNHHVDRFATFHEMRRRTFKAFAEEGIEIPFPHRTLYLRQEDSEAAFRFAATANGTGGAPAEPGDVAGKPYQGASE
jgi:small-conductance mechanosensitive channel